MRLTSRGWTVAVAGIGLYAGSRIIGTVELAMLSSGAGVALALAAVFALVGRPDVRIVRTLRPQRLHAGATAHAEIELTNRGRRTTPVLSVTDRFSGRREARFAVPPLPPGESARGGFRIPTGRRGVYRMGPLRVAVTDPLGLVRRPVVSRRAERVTVYPRVESVTSLPLTVGRDLVGGAVVDFTRSRTGDEFHGLREYAIGDDLRHVHWRSTAKTGELMIREHDVPWQTRATLLVDDRRAVHDDTSFERLVEATASIATALQRRRSIMRLVSSEGPETRFGAGHDHYESIMEHLAVLTPSSTDRYDQLAARLHRQTSSGALIAFTGHAEFQDLAGLATLRRRFGFVAVVRLGVSADDRATVPGTTLIDVAPGASFPDAWNEALVRRFGSGRALGGPR